MFCPRCGARDEASAARCTNCGYPLWQVAEIAGEGAPRSYLAQAVLIAVFSVSLLCLSLVLLVPLPLGLLQMAFSIVAIVYAVRVEGRIPDGDREGAAALSRRAKIWCLVAFLTGTAGFVLSAVMLALFVLSG